MRKRVFLENPYDVETVQAALKIADESDMSLLFLDQLIGTLRLDPQLDLTYGSHKILTKLKLMGDTVWTTQNLTANNNIS